MKERPIILKAHIVEDLKRHQVFLPSSSSDMCTIEFLFKVIKGQVARFKIEDIRFRYCVSPPPKLLVCRQLQLVLNEHGINLDVQTRKPGKFGRLDGRGI